MMASKEGHNLEWKESWHDEYLKWICGFANAEGGVLVIGRDDRGRVVGTPIAARLLERIETWPLSLPAPEIRFEPSGLWVSYPFPIEPADLAGALPISLGRKLGRKLGSRPSRITGCA